MSRQTYQPKSTPIVSKPYKGKASSKTSSKKSSSKGSAESLDVDKQTSANIRKIENGYIVSESGYTGKGKNQQYFSREYFSETNPVAGVKIQFGKKK